LKGTLNLHGKKIDELCSLGRTWGKGELVSHVFNNLYNRLWDLSTSTKLEANRDIMEFGVAQIVDILLCNWFQVDPTFIVSDSKEEDEGVARLALKVQVVKSSRILRVCF